MEGPTGLWWSTILTVAVGEAPRGTAFDSIAASLAVGIFLSAVLTIIIGVSGIGHRLAKLFSPTVMVFLILLLGAQLTTIFFKGMLGLPFSSTRLTPPFNGANGYRAGGDDPGAGDDYFSPGRYRLLCPADRNPGGMGELVPAVSHSARHGGIRADSLAVVSARLRRALRPGIILTALLAGLVNITNTYGAIRGTDVLSPTGRQQYPLPTALLSPD